MVSRGMALENAKLMQTIDSREGVQRASTLQLQNVT